MNKIEVGKNTVTKSSVPKLMEIEVEKTLRAYEIGEKCGLFTVPRVIEYDKSKGIAVFERIHQIKPVRNVIMSPKGCSSIIEQIARSLAIIHQELSLPVEMTIELPAMYRLPGTEVFIHGDFNGMNICIIPDSRSVVILDWQSTSQIGEVATFGSRYFDIVWFINFLLWTPTFKYLLYDPVKKISKLFIKSYFKNSNSFYDPELFMHYSERFFETRLPVRKNQTSWRKMYLLPRSKELTERFIKSIQIY